MVKYIDAINNNLSKFMQLKQSKNRNVLNLWNIVENNPYMLEAVKQELMIHSSLKHKNIV